MTERHTPSAAVTGQGAGWSEQQQRWLDVGAQILSVHQPLLGRDATLTDALVLLGWLQGKMDDMTRQMHQFQGNAAALAMARMNLERQLTAARIEIERLNETNGAA
jgi:hypothetical protein